MHLLFRAIPAGDAGRPADAASSPRACSFKLTPIYGVTIPVIVRLGNLQATAGIANVQLEKKDGKPAVGLDLSRSGTRSTFGEVRVLKAGVKDPIAIQKASPSIPRSASATSASRSTDNYKGERRLVRSRSNMSRPSTTASHLIAETQAVLR